MEVPKQSFNKSSWDSRTCYPRRAFNQGLTNNIAGMDDEWQIFSTINSFYILQLQAMARWRYLEQIWKASGEPKGVIGCLVAFI